MFIVPIPFLGLTMYGIWRYPALLCRGSTGRFQLRSIRFIYCRFHLDKYYYSLVRLVRALLICFVPIVARTDAGLQLFITVGFVLFANILQQHIQPWRLRSANLIDGLLNGIMIMIPFVCASVSD